MKLLMKLILITSTLFLASLIMAHEGHEHAKQLDQASAIEAASIKMAELIQEGSVTLALGATGRNACSTCQSKWASELDNFVSR